VTLLCCVLCVFLRVSSDNCAGSISKQSYDAIESLYNATDGWNWAWDPLQPLSTVWQFPTSLWTPCSSGWQGLVCVQQDMKDGSCDITEISLSYYNLVGSVASELGNLVNLHKLMLQYNSLNGSIPSELGNLTNLEVLELQFNSLDGTIPSELGNLVNLQELALQANWLNSSIPSELGRLANLGEMFLEYNLLAGTIPSELGNLKNLQYLLLATNSLSGFIPSELSNLASLVSIGLNSNSLNGSVPSEFGFLTKLTEIELQVNAFSGSISSQLGKLVNLLTLQLQSNSLTGSIPSELGNIVNLEAIEVSGNLFDGGIPSDLGLLLNLLVLNLDGNMLDGSIPSELGNLVNMESIELESNFLSEPLPLSLSRCSLLQSINLSTNLLSGNIDVFMHKNFTSLRVLDLSLNQLGGTVPGAVFSLPALQSVVLSQNCFSGSLSTLMCMNGELSSIVMDVLTGNCGTRDGDIFQGTILKNYMTGTIPACIWNSSALRTLHLLGNGLDGSLMDIPSTFALSVLALGSNQLTGTIPVTLQQHGFTQLDLSINRLSGTLASDLYISQHATVYDLSVNRLSGDIPTALFSSYSDGVMNVLEGNVFGCQQNNIPRSDTSHSSYQCGSVDLQYSLAAWAIGCVSCAITVIFVTLRLDWAVSKMCRSRDFIAVLAGPSCCFAICLVGMIGFVSMKLSSDKNDTSTYTVQYWWTSTVSFTHNWIICVFMSLNLVAICSVFTLTAVSLTRSPVSHHDTACGLMPALPSLLAHLTSMIVVTTINGVYVLAAIGSVNNTTLLAIQAVLGIFKLSWSSWVIPWLLSRARITGTNQVSHWLFMVLFVFLGAPFASSFCESSSCFLYVLTKPAPVSFSLISPFIYFTSLCTAGGCFYYSVPGEQLVQSSITVPWIYSYQCSSAVITGYAPVLVLSYLISGLIVPCSLLMVSILPARFASFVRQTLLVLKFTHVDSASAAELLDKKSVSVLATRTVVKYILNLGVMMTFGLAVPLLAVAILCDTAFNLILVLGLLESFIVACEKNGLSAGTLMQEFWSSFSLNKNEAVGCVHIVLGYVSIFWSLFAFDWIADVYGSLAGGLAMSVPLLVPSIIGHFILRGYPQQEQELVSRQQTSNIELGEIVNPVILPQCTNDVFSDPSTS
jgi:hypothetical protein